MGIVRVDYLNTMDGPRRKVRIPAVARAQASTPNIITRAQWGADESLKRTGGSCRRRFYRVQQLFVHHTAGTNFDPNPAATMRAIYHFHARRRGWCDIGYNFVISHDGRIFEGRWARHYRPWEAHSGEDVHGRAVAGAHVSDFNSGSVGVSLMGNFQNVTPSPASRRALAELLAWEADRHKISPLGTHTFRSPASGATRERQIGDVGASHEQHQSHGDHDRGHERTGDRVHALVHLHVRGGHQEPRPRRVVGPTETPIERDADRMRDVVLDGVFTVDGPTSAPKPDRYEVASVYEWRWPQSQFDLVVAIFVQFADPAMRRFMFERMIGALRPGGLALVEGYTPAQLKYATGGPREVDQLYTEDVLREAFGALEILELRAYEAELDEGTRHSGMSAVIDLVARKNMRA